MSNAENHDGSLEAAAARAAASRARTDAERGIAAGSLSPDPIGSVRPASEFAGNVGGVSRGAKAGRDSGSQRVGAWAVIARIFKVIGVLAVLAAVWGVIAFIDSIFLVFANVGRDPWHQLDFWEGFPLMLGFLFNPITLVVLAILAVVILVLVYGRDPKCPHCGAKTEARYRVCKSCGRVK